MTCGDSHTCCRRVLDTAGAVTRFRGGRPPLQDGRRGRGGQTPNRRPSVGTDRACTLSRQRGRPRSRRGRRRTEETCGPGRAPARSRAGTDRAPGTRGDYASGMSDRDGRLPPAVALVLALVSGVALDLAFPDPGWWMLAAPGIAGLTLAVRGASTRWAALLGLVAGLGCFVPLLHWSGVYVGVLPWLALAVSQACFVALVGAGLAWAWRVPGGRAGTVLAVSGLWVLGEGLRARLPFGGFPWGRLAFSQSDAPALGWAAVGGAPLVSAVVAAAGGCLAVAVADLLRRRAGFPAGAAVCAAVAVGLVAAGPLGLTLGNVG